jgi:hypothetical protein
VASSVVSPARGGRIESGRITNGGVPGMLKSIVSGPALEFASRIACRREPPPESFVFVTVKVPAETAPAKAIESPRPDARSRRWLSMSPPVSVAIRRGH